MSSLETYFANGLELGSVPIAYDKQIIVEYRILLIFSNFQEAHQFFGFIIGLSINVPLLLITCLLMRKRHIKVFKYSTPAKPLKELETNMVDRMNYVKISAS